MNFDMRHHLATTARRLARLRREDGITMIIALGVTFITGLTLVAVFATTRGEIHLTSLDRSQKKAYYAAEAGIQDYEYHLTQDGNYLSYCTEPPSPNLALNQYYKENTKELLKPSELKTVEVPAPKEASGEQPTEEHYAIQLIPAESSKEKYPKCNPNNLVESMVEEKGSATGTFRIAATGFSGGEQRTLIATFKNANFVSYVWYSVYETGDPALYGQVPPGKSATYWTECGNFFGSRPARCEGFDNYFITGESINGPMHTQDHVGVCGKPSFGRTGTDRIEFGNGGNIIGEGYSKENCGETAAPEFKGTHVPPKEVLAITPPPGDEELQHIVEPAYEFKGLTEIVLEESTMTIKKDYIENTTTHELEPQEISKTVPYPQSGVIYVAGSCSLYSPFGPSPGYNSTESTSCGDVYVHGDYTSSLTIAAQNDVIINGNITTEVNGEGVPTSNALLGLVANNFVRVAHPVEQTYKKVSGKCKTNSYPDSITITDPTNSAGLCVYTNEAHLILKGSEYEAIDVCDAPNSGVVATPGTGPNRGDLKEPVIYAGILALKHSFIVDNFDCGSPEFGSLKLYGAIAGDFSNGMTGVFSGHTIEHGYGYNLIYDNRLQVEEPPHFLNPIQAAWYIQRDTLASAP
jgi:Tfp pilus assembly protein PilX